MLNKWFLILSRAPPFFHKLGWFYGGDGGGSKYFGSDGSFDTVEVVR
jgi:hypothetical protein